MKLDDFLKFKKVRYINLDGKGLTNKEYELLGVTDRSCIITDNGCEIWASMDNFEPVLDSAENPLENIELTHEFKAVEPTFKVGDKVYFPRLSNKLCVIVEGQEDDYVDEVNGSKLLADMQSDLDFVYDQKTRSWLWGEKDCAPQLLYATQENYEMLCKLYPHIEFEQPNKELTGSDLARAMLDNGWKYVPCYVSNYGESEAQKPCIVRKFSSSGQFVSEFGFYNNAVPFDPKTGEILTESVLND